MQWQFFYNMKIKIIFLGTTDFAVHQLQALHESFTYEVVMVVSQPDKKAGRSMKLQQSVVKKYALKNNLSVITPEKMNLALSQIKNLKATAAVVVAYGQILSQDFLDLFPQKVVNLHASLLPRWRGAAPIQRAIMADDKVTGVSLQVMVKALDAGDVIGEKKIEIDKNLNSLELHHKLSLLGPDLLLTDFTNYLRSKDWRLLLKKQDKALVTYAHKIEKSEQKINWQRSAIEVHNFIRGLALNRGASCNFDLKNQEQITCKIHKTKVVTGITIPSLTSGSIAELSANSFTIACGPDKNNLDYLEIIELQLPSRARSSVKDFLNLNLISSKTQFS